MLKSADKCECNDYNYTNISTSGTFENKTFTELTYSNQETSTYLYDTYDLEAPSSITGRQ